MLITSIYTLEKAAHHLGVPPSPDVEASPLLTNPAEGPKQTFRRALDAELEKICRFYQSKEHEIYDEASKMLKDEQTYHTERESEDFQLDQAGHSGRARGHSNASRPGSILRNLGFGRPRRASTMSDSIDMAEEDSDDGTLDESNTLKRSRTFHGIAQPQDTAAGQSVDDLRSSREIHPQRRRSTVGFEDYSGQALLTLYESGITLKKRAISLYVSLCELKSFVQLNKTGFSKALKKFDKILDQDLRSTYIEDSINPAYPFRKQTMQGLDDRISKIEKAYAEVVTKGDLAQAQKELRSHLREHVVWERNTVWRELIGIERKAQAAKVGFRGTVLGDRYGGARARLQGDNGDDSDFKEVVTPIGKFYLPKWVLSANLLILLGIMAIFITLLFVPILKKPEQQNCLAMLVLVSLLWATEVCLRFPAFPDYCVSLRLTPIQIIPLFVTSLLVPFLVVVLRIVCSDQKPYQRLGAKAAATYIISAMWTPVIILLLGGFTIAAALSKYHIAKSLATFFLSKAGTRPRTVLLTNMLVAMIMSMWISNVAAPVLSYSIIQVRLCY